MIPGITASSIRVGGPDVSIESYTSTDAIILIGEGDGSISLERAPDSGGSPGTWSEIATGLAAGDSYNDTGLSAGTKYWWRAKSTGYGDPATVTLPAAGTMTLVAREPFISIGDLTSGSPGSNLTEVVGTLRKRLHGPRVAGQAKGWSADIRQPSGTSQTFGRTLMPGANGASGGTAWSRVMISGWYYFRQDSIANNTNSGTLLGFERFAKNNQVGIYIEAISAKIRARVGSATAVDFPVAFYERWVWLAVAARHVSGSNYDVKFYYKLPGQAMTEWASFTNTGGFYGPADLDYGITGCYAISSTQNPDGRLGCPSIHTFTSNTFADVTHPPDVAEPSDAGKTWYVNPATGSDANDGGSPNQAWQTVSKLNDEMLYTGIFSKYHQSSSAGDTIVIDTSAAPLDLAGTNLLFRSHAINVRAATGQTWIDIKTHKTLANASFSKTGGYTNIYEIADTQANTVLWEDDKWLAKPNTGTLATALTYLDANPGSFYTDGTKMYVHPTGSTNPVTDGKVYDRSRDYSAVGIEAIGLWCRNYDVRNIRSGKTCMAVAATGDGIGAYGIGDANFSSTGAVNRLQDCYLSYCSKHAYGFVTGNTNEDLTIENCQGEQCTPYGSMTVFVSYKGSGTGNIHRYRNCTVEKSIGLIGSTAGVSNYAGDFYSHNLGGANNFTLFEFDNCDMAGAVGGGAVDLVTITNCRFGRIGFANVEADRSELSMFSAAGGHLRNSKIVVTDYDMDGTNVGELSGTVEISNVVLDLSGAAGAISDRGGLWKRTAALNLSFFNNIFLGDGVQPYMVVHDVAAGDTLDFHHNRYHNLGSSGYIAHYDGTQRTLAQMEALGFERDSTIGSPGVDGSYAPTSGASAVVAAGYDVGEAREDFTGVSFPFRNDIGPYEFVESPAPDSPDEPAPFFALGADLDPQDDGIHYVTPPLPARAVSMRLWSKLNDGGAWRLVESGLAGGASGVDTYWERGDGLVDYRVEAMNFSGGTTGEAESVESLEPTDPTRFWPMSEASGNRVDNFASAALTDTNTVGSNTGVTGNAAEFVAANSEMLIGALPSHDPGGFSVMFDIRVASAPGGTQMIASVYNDAGDKSWTISLTAGLAINVHTYNDPDDAAATSSGVITSGQFNRVICVFKPDGDVLVSINGGTYEALSTGYFPMISAESLRIGGNETLSNYFDGRIDNFSYWAAAQLTQREAAGLWNAGGTPLVWAPFDWS